jgi:hypothetical protein
MNHMASVLAAWKAIKGRHPALSNAAKFKPDITPFCAKIDEDAHKFDHLDEEKKKAGKIIEDAGVQIDAQAAKIAAKTDEVSNLTDQIAASQSQDVDLNGDDAVKSVLQIVTVFEDLAKKRSAAAQEVAKLSDEQAKLAKRAAEQFKAKRDSIDAAQKKLSAEGVKLAAEIKRLVGVYQKIATGMKDSKMASDIGTLLNVDPG